MPAGLPGSSDAAVEASGRGGDNARARAGPATPQTGVPPPPAARHAGPTLSPASAVSPGGSRPEATAEGGADVQSRDIGGSAGDRATRAPPAGHAAPRPGALSARAPAVTSQCPPHR